MTKVQITLQYLNEYNMILMINCLEFEKCNIHILPQR